jgi:hypothetical protein
MEQAEQNKLAHCVCVCARMCGGGGGVWGGGGVKGELVISEF